MEPSWEAARAAHNVGAWLVRFFAEDAIGQRACFAPTVFDEQAITGSLNRLVAVTLAKYQPDFRAIRPVQYWIIVRIDGDEYSTAGDGLPLMAIAGPHVPRRELPRAH